MIFWVFALIGRTMRFERFRMAKQLIHKFFMPHLGNTIATVGIWAQVGTVNFSSSSYRYQKTMGL